MINVPLHIVLLFRIWNNGSSLITGSGGTDSRHHGCNDHFPQNFGCYRTKIHQYKIPATLQIQVQIKRPFCLSFFRFLRWGGFSEKKRRHYAESFTRKLAICGSVRAWTNIYTCFPLKVSLFLTQIPSLLLRFFKSLNRGTLHSVFYDKIFGEK